jgi:hypothetical protein
METAIAILSLLSFGARCAGRALLVVIVAPVRYLLGAPVVLSVLLLSVGSVSSVVIGLLADWLIGLCLMSAHLLAQYALHRDARSDCAQHPWCLRGLVGLYALVLLVGTAFAWKAGVIGLWLVCCLVMVIHMSLGRRVPHS